jgi:hypothetical protein
VAVIVLNHVVHLALKATEAVIASKAVAIALTTVRQRHALKAVAIHALKRASNLVVNSAANPVNSRLAAKVALNPVVISAKRVALTTALTLATLAQLAHPIVSTRVAVPAIVLHADPKLSVLATSSLTTLADTLHPSALAPRC